MAQENNNKTMKELDEIIKSNNIPLFFADMVATRFRLKLNAQKPDSPPNTPMYELIFYDNTTNVIMVRVMVDELLLNDLIKQFNKVKDDFEQMKKPNV